MFFESLTAVSFPISTKDDSVNIHVSSTSSMSSSYLSLVLLCFTEMCLVRPPLLLQALLHVVHKKNQAEPTKKQQLAETCVQCLECTDHQKRL